ncbi:MAG: phosphonate ABC transporter, permease protein PhnE [Armatimonadetes bacterium RBG_16_58_9]|nr:MAG: phosphonate ABC transporter, permease protein PhnE [Armatimonadetes bacterium RBG_16_58_9]
MEASRPTPRSPALAALLSIVVPGLGQVYAGQWRRGVSLILGLSAQAALFYGVGLSWLSVCMAPLWPWVVWDAYCAARGKKVPATGPVVLVLLLNLVAASNVTQVHVPKLAPEQRGVMRRIVGGLASPDFLKRTAETREAVGKYVVPGPGALSSLESEPAKAHKPRITITPVRAEKGDNLTVWGRGFVPNESGTLSLLGANEIDLGGFHTDKNGRFAATIVNPRDIPGAYFVHARQVVPGKGWELSETLKDAGPRMLETIYLALLGTAWSLVFALPLSFFGARNLMSGARPLKLIYGLIRALFTALRSVEVLIFAVIAVAAVGIGPFAGVLALAIHGVGALGKLYSEAIESIEHGPIEAIRSTGANEVQVVMYGVVPQVVPQFIAFTLYRWDINVRMATVIGLVGGGGIGYQLIQYMNLLQWRQAATAIWLIAGVVMLMDYASAVIREKIV